MNIKKLNHGVFKCAIFTAIMTLSLGSFNAYSQDHDNMKHDHKTEMVTPNGKTIQKIINDYHMAIVDKNIEKVGSFVTGETFSILEGKHPNWGWTDYRDNHLGLELKSTKFKILSFILSDFKITEGQQLAYAVYSVQMEFEIEGVKKTRDGVATTVMEKHGQTWLIKHIHTS